MKRTLLFTGLLFLTLLGCKSQQYTFEELPDKQLVFGYGGGMAGTVDTYVLLENGQLFHTNSLTQQTEELEPLSKKEASACFLKFEELSLSETDFDHPGSRYYFLEEVNQDAKHKVVWGASDHKPSERFLDFYKEMKNHIK
ncbi:hypothetical protein [Zobellia barbeyronii]|uniref:Lipoprotein n=1 Tax=Zobellia barbeyronii TaxID=2748009 RepID=A0ABS5WJD0_9FLAO|nr:hypothetical protein [Zobellia barbeyronii]MBT2163108.1 hypothetical protein [Zobellia barbeyronii]